MQGFLVKYTAHLSWLSLEAGSGGGGGGVEASRRQINGLPTSMSKLAKMGKEASFTSVLWNRPSIGQSGSSCPIYQLPKLVFID